MTKELSKKLVRQDLHAGRTLFYDAIEELFELDSEVAGIFLKGTVNMLGQLLQLERQRSEK